MRGLGVVDYRQEGGGEISEEIADETGVPFAIDDVVIAIHHHVEISYDPFKLALTRICDIRGRASFRSWRGIC